MRRRGAAGTGRGWLSASGRHRIRSSQTHRSGHWVGPSTGEVVGSSWTSMNRPSTPHATAASGTQRGAWSGGQGG